MDNSITMTYEDLQREVAGLRRANAALLAERSSLIHIATSALRALGLQSDPLNPEGAWLQHVSLGPLWEIISPWTAAMVHVGGGSGAWFWHKFTLLFPVDALPEFPTEDYDFWFGRGSPYEVKPFERSFPLELFEVIISFADARAIARTARASFVCYELFMPLLLDRIETPHDGRLSVLFDESTKMLPRSPRVALVQSLLCLRSLVLTSECCDRFFADDPSDCIDRFGPQTGTLDLEVFTIVINQDRPRADQRWTSVLPYGSQDLLAALNPLALIVELQEDPDEFYARPHGICRESAYAMSSWTRLQTVRLEHVNLMTWSDIQGDEPPNAFFLCDRNDIIGQAGEVYITWNISQFTTETASLGDQELLDALLHRDDTLQQPWVEDFLVILGNKEVGKEFQDLIDKAGDAVPSCLRWEVE